MHNMTQISGAEGASGVGGGRGGEGRRIGWPEGQQYFLFSVSNKWLEIVALPSNPPEC